MPHITYTSLVPSPLGSGRQTRSTVAFKCGANLPKSRDCSISGSLQEPRIYPDCLNTSLPSAPANEQRRRVLSTTLLIGLFKKPFRAICRYSPSGDDEEVCQRRQYHEPESGRQVLGGTGISTRGHKHEGLHQDSPSTSLGFSSRRASRLWFAKPISISFRAIGQSPDIDKDRDNTRRAWPAWSSDGVYRVMSISPFSLVKTVPLRHWPCIRVPSQPCCSPRLNLGPDRPTTLFPRAGVTSYLQASSSPAGQMFRIVTHHHELGRNTLAMM